MAGVNVAIVGGDTLLAREIEAVFTERAPEVVLLKTGLEQEEREARRRREEDEVEVVLAFDEAILEATRLVILAGTEEAGRKAYQLVRRRRPPLPLIDLTYALEDEPAARLRAPLAEPLEVSREAGELFVVAHPAAIVLAAFFRQLAARHPVHRWLVHVFEPASERGKVGVEELQQQTVQLLSFRSLPKQVFAEQLSFNLLARYGSEELQQQTVQLLSFRSLPKQVFAEQLSFNLLARYGSEAPRSLQSIEARLERHLATLLARANLMPMPSLRLIQAPVFHGHSFSVWIEFDRPPQVAELAASLASEAIEVRGADQEPPTNVGVAGQSGMTVGVIEIDRNDPRAAWFWIVADNHRTTAENTVRLAEMILAGEGGR